MFSGSIFGEKPIKKNYKAKLILNKTLKIRYEYYRSNKKRRSILHYNPSFKIPEEDIEELIELAMLSPTSYNIQHWKFVVVSDPKLRNKIREADYNHQQITDASILIIVVSDVKAFEKEMPYKWRKVPVEVQNFMVPRSKEFYYDKEKLQRDEAITASMPGMIYEFQDNDRHFGGFIPSLQYWVKDRCWIHGGIGLAIDSPALYGVEEDVNDDWNFGCAVMASTGYEVYKKKNFALNLQSKLVLGRAFLDGDMHRDALIFNIGLGFSWL